MASASEPGRPRRAIRCWGCEELLALVGLDGRVIVEADAETTCTDGRPVILCPCGAKTVLRGDWALDER